jgi:predicted nucleic acid-binding protein
MSSNKVFIDTSGLFALLISNDPYHTTAKNFLETVKKDKLSVHTSDYILEETYTLLKARKVPSQIRTLSTLIDQSKVLKIHWSGSDLFQSTERFFLQHKDQNYSFTDCLSFILMKKYAIKSALTTDKHFIQAGFQTI